MNIFKQLLRGQHGVESDHSAIPRFNRFRKNVGGDFYVMAGCCTCCGAPHAESPELIQNSADDPDVDENDSSGWSCYFKKQPANAFELKSAIDACEVSCMQALRYGGNDPNVIAEFKRRGMPHLCDALLPSDAEIERRYQIAKQKHEFVHGFSFLFEDESND